MVDFSLEIRSERFVRAVDPRTFINNNLDQLFLSVKEDVQTFGVSNLKELGIAIQDLYNIYGSSEVTSYVYKLSDIHAHRFGLKSITLFGGLSLVYPKYDDFKLIIAEGAEGRGTGPVGLTRLVYSNKTRLVDYLRTNTIDKDRVEKGKHVINVGGVFRAKTEPQNDPK